MNILAKKAKRKAVYHAANAKVANLSNDSDLTNHLLTPLAMINKYYFDTKPNTLLIEIKYKDSLTERAAFMQRSATRRIKQQLPDFIKQVHRWRIFRETGKFYMLSSIDKDGTILAASNRESK